MDTTVTNLSGDGIRHEMDEVESSKQEFQLADRFTNVNYLWCQMSALNREYMPVNIGSGYPESDTPDFLAEALISTQEPGSFKMNQYTMPMGHPRFRKALAELYGPLLGRTLDPDKEILVTVGASEALFCTINSIINPGDEVILIEPFFNFFNRIVQVSQGLAVTVLLHKCKNATNATDFYINEVELEAAFTPRTKAIIINNPHNPTGKVFSRAELEMIADKVKKYNCLCISDEVYEWLVFDDKKHIRMATLPGMWERTVSIYSGGKSFHVTGWKIGWAIAKHSIIQNLIAAHSSSIMTFSTPFQVAFACAIEKQLKLLGTEESYWQNFTNELQRKRDDFMVMLKGCGMKPIMPAGTYFFLLDISNIDFPHLDKEDSRDWACVKWLIKEKGLSVIPASPLYSQKNASLGSQYVRICFAKNEDTVENARRILQTISVLS